MEDVFAEHNRSFLETRFIYPVISRRSGGLSLGINLDYDKTCNFDCPYCQVNRREIPEQAFDFQRMQKELHWAIEYLQSPEVFTLPRFKSTPENFKVWKDIAIAGDGEPSVNPHLLPTMQFLKTLAAKLPQIVLISNATGLKRPKTQEALQILSQMGGVLWAKLDAGTQEYFEIVSGSKMKLQSIENRILSVPPSLRLCIQICLMKVNGVSPSTYEIACLQERLQRIHESHRLEAVQVYTIARPPAQTIVDPISLRELTTICQPLMDANLPVKLYSGAAD